MFVKSRGIYHGSEGPKQNQWTTLTGDRDQVLPLNGWPTISIFVVMNFWVLVVSTVKKPSETTEESIVLTYGGGNRHKSLVKRLWTLHNNFSKQIYNQCKGWSSIRENLVGDTEKTKYYNRRSCSRPSTMSKLFINNFFSPSFVHRVVCDGVYDSS